MIKGLSKILKQQGFFQLQLLNKAGASLEKRTLQLIQSELHKSQKYSFARLNKQNKGFSKHNLKEDYVNEEEIQNEIQEENENDLHFELTAETFDKILDAIKEKGQGLIEVISQSDLKDKIMKNNFNDKNALISCLRVLEKCQILDNPLREYLYKQLKNRHLFDAEYSNQELGVILQYFMLKSQKKLYLIELESFYLQRLNQLGERHLRQLIDIYSKNFKGSEEFYNAIQDRILTLIENGAENKQNKISFSNLMNVYLPAFTKANYFNKRMEMYIIQQIEQKLLAEEYQHYFKETVLPYVPNILFFFALQFESTKHMHEVLLKLIQIHHQKDRELPLNVSKPLNIFLKVYSLFQDKEIEEFFQPVMRYKNMHVESSIVQEEIKPYLLKFIPKLHLKENHYIDSFNVDYFTYLDNKKIVIEVNGRFHYVHNRYSGVYSIKRRCLEKEAYIILEIKDYDWNSLEENQKEIFIARLLSPYVQKAHKFLIEQK